MFQLSFLNAGLLIFAAATVLPLIIWLLAKKKPPQLLFSSLRFMKLSSEQEKSRTRLTNIILLIIRMLILLLLALAVARPMLSSRLFGGSQKHPPTAVAIVLDTSYSMDYTQDRQSRMDIALSAIQTINSRATDSDRLILITRDEIYNDLHAQIYAGEIPEESLQSLSLSWKPMPWAETIAFAEAKLAEAQMPNSEIYLLSDFVNEDMSFTSSHPIAAIPISESDPRQNISISEARPLPQIVGRSKQQTIEYRITNHGSQDRNELLVQAVLGEIKVAERFVSVPARQSVVENITFDIHRDGWQSGYIEVLDGYLNADNRSYFAFEFHQNPRVAVISAGSLPTQLMSILRVYGGGNNPDIIHPSAVNLQQLGDYKLVVFYEVGELSPRLRAVISELDAKEIGSLFCLGSTLSADMKAFLNNRFGQNISDYQSEALSIDYISPHHHATGLIADKDLRFGRINAYWNSPARGEALISGSSRALAVQKLSSALWLWDISSNSEFFSDPAFAVFAYRTFSTLQSGRVPVAELRVGDAINARHLIVPGGEDVHLANPQFITHQPGIYTISPQSSDPAKVAVNISYDDSETHVPELPKQIKMLPEDFEEEIFMSRLGRDLWKLLLILALLLVVIEIIIVKYQEHKSLHRSES